MKKKLFLLLILIISIRIFADEYIIIWSQDEYLTADMLQKYNESLEKYGEVKYEGLSEYQAIAWKDEGESKVSELDIDNDGEVEKVVKSDKYLNTYITEVLDIYKGEKKIGSVGEFEGNKYELKNMPKEEDYYNYMAGTFEIHPFEYEGRRYVSVESKYGNHEFMVVGEITNNKFIESSYYIKIQSLNAPKNIELSYRESLKLFKESKDVEKAIEELEKNKVQQILRNKGEDINIGSYIRILNDYAYFLKLAGRNREGLAILRDVIYLNPKRAVAYYNLGNIYYELEDKKRARYCYWKYKSLLKGNATIPQKVKEELMEYSLEEDIKLENISNPNYKLEYILIMSEDNDLCQEVRKVINENFEREVKEYGAGINRLTDQYVGKGFDGFTWEDKAFKGYGRVYISYFDIDNDGQKDLVEKSINYLSDIMSDRIEYFNKKDKELYFEIMDKVKDEGMEIYRDKLSNKIKGHISPNKIILKKLPEHSSHNSKYRFKYPYNIWPYRFNDKYYLIMREGQGDGLNLGLGLLLIIDSKQNHLGYYIQSKH